MSEQTEQEQQIAAIPGVLVPFMHWEKFAEQSGVSSEVLRGLMDKGYIPSLRLGRHRFVNVAKAFQMALAA